MHSCCCIQFSVPKMIWSYFRNLVIKTQPNKFSSSLPSWRQEISMLLKLQSRSQDCTVLWSCCPVPFCTMVLQSCCPVPFWTMAKIANRWDHSEVMRSCKFCKPEIGYFCGSGSHEPGFLTNLCPLNCDFASWNRPHLSFISVYRFLNFRKYVRSI